MSEDKSVIRIVICGAGYYGGRIAAMAVEKGWQVVAAFNRAGDKVGKDLGIHFATCLCLWRL